MLRPVDGRVDEMQVGEGGDILCLVCGKPAGQCRMDGATLCRGLKNQL